MTQKSKNNPSHKAEGGAVLKNGNIFRTIQEKT